MKYDTSVPATRNEMKSLLVLLVVLAVGGISAWGILHFVSAKTRTGQTATTARAPVDGSIQRMSDTYALVRGRDTYVNIYARGNEMSVRRAAGPNDPALNENWNLARIVQRIVNNPETAKMYGMENKIAALKELDLQVPTLTPAEQSKLGMLFLQTQGLTGDARNEADQALIVEVASVPIAQKDQDAFDAGIAKLKTILTPAEIESLRMGRRVTTMPRPAASRP